MPFCLCAFMCDSVPYIFAFPLFGISLVAFASVVKIFQPFSLFKDTDIGNKILSDIKNNYFELIERYAFVYLTGYKIKTKNGDIINVTNDTDPCDNYNFIDDYSVKLNGSRLIISNILGREILTTITTKLSEREDTTKTTFRTKNNIPL